MYKTQEFNFTPRYICYCGTHGAENAAAAQQSSFTSSLLSQASTVFGADNSVFNAMSKAYSGIVAAGPSQEGFSAAEQNAINSQIVNNAAVSNRNISSAVNSRMSAVGGGNTPMAPTGAEANQNASIAEAVQAQESGQLTNATIANYEQGNQNWQVAGGMLAKAPGVFNNLGEVDKAAQSGLSANMANAEAADAASNWWVKPVEGMAGAGLNMLAPGLGSGLMPSGGGSGGSGGLLSTVAGMVSNWGTNTNNGGNGSDSFLGNTPQSQLPMGAPLAPRD